MNSFVIFPDSANLLNKMDSLTNIFVCLVRYSYQHSGLSEDVSKDSHVSWYVSSSDYLFTVALTACPQSLSDSLPGRCDATSQA